MSTESQHNLNLEDMPYEQLIELPEEDLLKLSNERLTKLYSNLQESTAILAGQRERGTRINAQDSSKVRAKKEREFKTDKQDEIEKNFAIRLKKIRNALEKKGLQAPTMAERGL